MPAVSRADVGKAAGNPFSHSRGQEAHKIMKCPYCSFDESKVIDSRPTDEGERIRRRRECLRCGKRFTTYEILETMLQNSLDREVPSSQSGAYAMEKLRDIDEVAYVRFASVYREFKDINSFMEELSRIKSAKETKEKSAAADAQ